jgi:hypothetical protein
MPAQEVLARARDPRTVAVAMVAPHRLRVLHVGAVIARDVVPVHVTRGQVPRGHEPPGVLGHVRVAVVEARRCPADDVVADAPLHPRRSPARVGAPHPAAAPDPAAVVRGRPAERLVRHPGPAVVRVCPVPVRVRDVVVALRREHVAVVRVVVPLAVRVERVVEDGDVWNFATRRLRGHVEVLRTGIVVVRQPTRCIGERLIVRVCRAGRIRRL